MKFMPFLLVGASLCAFAQDPPPVPAATQTPEQALRERAQKFYDALVAQKPRLSQEFVCEEGKDAYYQKPKAKMTSAQVDKVRLSPDSSSAIVTTLIRPSLPFNLNQPMAPIPSDSNWKVDGGQWCYVLPAAPTAVVTPFGKLDFSGKSGAFSQTQGADILRSLAEKVRFSKTEIALPGKVSGSDEVEITNGAGGEVRLEVACPAAPGLTCHLDKSKLLAGEAVKLRVDFHNSGTPLASGLSVAVRIQPFDQIIALPITAQKE